MRHCLPISLFVSFEFLNGTRGLGGGGGGERNGEISVRRESGSYPFNAFQVDRSLLKNSLRIQFAGVRNGITVRHFSKITNVQLSSVIFA